MIVEVGNLHSRIATATPEEAAFVDGYLSFEDPNARFKSGGGDGRTRLYNAFARSFPTGFLPLVTKAAREEAGIKLEVLDRRKVPVTFDPSANLAWLRDYQREGVDRIVERGRGILWHATGAGKTETLIGLTRALPCRWLFIAHRQGLADQAADRYEKRAREHGTGDGPAGRIYDGGWSEGERITCVTFQSLYERLKDGDAKVMRLLAEADAVAVDECHVLPANSFFQVAMATSGAYYRVGLSGTPLARGDRRSIYAIAALGPIVHRVKAEVLVKLGVLARPHVRMTTVRQASSRATWAGVYGDLIVKSTLRNDALVRAMAGARKPALLFVKEVAHGRELVRRLGLAGITAEFVYGSHSLEYRKSVVRRLVAGHFDVLVCSVIFREGIDIPELRAVGLGAGGKSTIAVLQELGRGMRVDRDEAGNVREGGAEFEVYDIFDLGNKWTERHAKERRRAYAAEGFETVVEGEQVRMRGVAK